MSETEFQLLRGGGVTVALAVALVAQRRSPHARAVGSWRTNGMFWVLDAAVMATACGACACAVARWAEAQGVGLFHSLATPRWVTVLGTIAALDLVSYTWHRANHVVPALWRFHQVHHSDPTFTVSTAMRFHPGELLLSLPLRLVAVAAVGASPAAVVVFEVVFAFVNLFEHGDIDLPHRAERWLGRLCITPALHRLHHSRKPLELNSNFGTVLVVWDRALGTYQPSTSARVVENGLPYPAQANTLAQGMALPFSKTSTARHL